MTWGERIDTRLHAKDSAAQECMAIVRELAAEMDTLQGLLKKSLEREEQIEKELSEARAQVAVLRGALETATDYMYNPFEPDNQCAQYKNIKNILQTTPAEAAERAKAIEQKLADARDQVAVLSGCLYLVRDEIDKYGSQANLAWLLESAEEQLTREHVLQIVNMREALETIQDLLAASRYIDDVGQAYEVAARALRGAK